MDTNLFKCKNVFNLFQTVYDMKLSEKFTVESGVFREDNGGHGDSGSGGGVSGGVPAIPSFIDFRDGSSLK